MTEEAPTENVDEAPLRAEAAALEAAAPAVEAAPPADDALVLVAIPPLVAEVEAAAEAELRADETAEEPPEAGADELVKTRLEAVSR